MSYEFEVWVTRDYGGEGKALTLSKKPLGCFVYHLLRLGGGIVDTWAMGPDYDRSYVQFSIKLPKGREQELQTKTGVTLQRLPQLSPSSRAHPS